MVFRASNYLLNWAFLRRVRGSPVRKRSPIPPRRRWDLSLSPSLIVSLQYVFSVVFFLKTHEQISWEFHLLLNDKNALTDECVDFSNYTILDVSFLCSNENNFGGWYAHRNRFFDPWPQCNVYYLTLLYTLYHLLSGPFHSHNCKLNFFFPAIDIWDACEYRLLKFSRVWAFEHPDFFSHLYAVPSNMPT